MRCRTLVAFAWLVGATVGCQVEPPYFGPPSASATPYQTDFDLTPEHPVAVRGLRFVVDPGEPLSAANLTLSVHDRESRGFGGSDEKTWITIVDPRTGRSLEHDAGIGHASVDGWGHGADCPLTGCDRTWAVIVRWLEPKPDQSVKLRLGASVTLTGVNVAWRQESAPPLMVDALSVTDVPALDFDRASAMLTATDGGSFRSTPDWAGETHRWTLHVPAALLREPAHFPRLGRVLLSETVTGGTGVPAAFEAHFQVGNATTQSSGGPLALELDWLAGCRVGVECEVPISVTFGWKPFDAREFGADAFMAADWTVVAMLEDPSAGAGLPEALSLEPVPGS